MKYKKNIFGKIISSNEKYHGTRTAVKNPQSNYAKSKIQYVHFLFGYIFIWCIYLILAIFFDIEIKSTNPIEIFFLIYGIPAIFGIIKSMLIDAIFNKIDWKIKWYFAFFVTTLFVSLIIFIKNQ